MRLADKPVLDSAAIFNMAVEGFEAGRGMVLDERGDISFEDSPPPRRLAPYAAAMGAVAYRDGIEAGSGRLVLLYDPDGQEGWTGVFRLVMQCLGESPGRILKLAILKTRAANLGPARRILIYDGFSRGADPGR